jgi:hypothetical protein
MAKDKKKSFVKWLEILQQESWQLELLISGFAIFLLASAYDQLDGFEYQINLLTTGSSYFGTLLLPFQIIMGAWYVLIINLVLHVLLRGLWISTIGIRYVSGEIDFEILKFSPNFDRFLKKRIVSFDLYIQKLEQLCSIVFGFTFLIIFILISFGLFVIGAVLLGISINTIVENYHNGWLTLLIPFLILYLFGGLIYFIDFMTLGWVKKRKSISKLYYPIYRFFSVVTLSFVYRPLYYNLIDNKYGRKVVLFLIPYLVIFTLISSMRFETHSYLPDQRNHYTLGNDRYDDTWDGTKLLSVASIQSKFISNGYMELYLPYIGKTDDQVIAHLCPDLEPAKKGVFFLSNNDEARNNMDADIALDCHSQRFQIFVNDSLFENIKYRFYDHPERKNNGLTTILDVSFLSRGEHNLKIKVLFPESVADKDTLVFRQNDNIPFWKE